MSNLASIRPAASPRRVIAYFDREHSYLSVSPKQLQQLLAYSGEQDGVALMRVTKGGLLAAILAALSAGAVIAAAYFAISHNVELAATLRQMDRAAAGVVTLLIMLTAGGLLAIAFDRGEKAARLLRRPSSEQPGSGA
jgi:hypothetical protein